MSTKKCGVIGNQVARSLSPKMYGAAFLQYGLNITYNLIEIQPAELERTIQEIRSQDFIGANVTIPYKESVIPFLDSLDQKAEMVGSVNTIVNNNGKLTGYTTDGDGFVISVLEELGETPQGKKVAIFGAGGSARSIAFALAENKILELILINRTKTKASELARNICTYYPILKITVAELSDPTLSDILAQSDWVINCTPVGMSPEKNQSPVSDYTWVNPSQLIYDIIYNPIETLFLKNAKASGAKTLNGISMLAGQGMFAFELFTGKHIEYSFMKSML